MSVRIPSHLKERFDALESMPVASSLPPPWSGPTTIAVGGLTDVGFRDSSDLLMCISSTGRGVIDCLAGSKIARDDSDELAFDLGNLLAAGIGPLADAQIRTAGLAGGGLPSGTQDGWSAQRHPFAFPDEQLFVAPPGQTMLWTRRGGPPRAVMMESRAASSRACAAAHVAVCAVARSSGLAAHQASQGPHIRARMEPGSSTAASSSTSPARKRSSGPASAAKSVAAPANTPSAGPNSAAASASMAARSSGSVMRQAGRGGSAHADRSSVKTRGSNGVLVMFGLGPLIALALSAPT